MTARSLAALVSLDPDNVITDDAMQEARLGRQLRATVEAQARELACLHAQRDCAVGSILADACRAGLVTNINITCDDAADLAERVEQLESAGCDVGDAPAPLDYGDGRVCLHTARYLHTAIGECVQIGLTTRDEVAPRGPSSRSGAA